MEVEFRCEERRFRLRIRNGFPQVRILKRGEPGELLSPPFGHQSSELLGVIGEIQERGRRRELLPHEEQRRLWTGEQHCRGDRVTIETDIVVQAIAERAVPHLIVVLNAEDKRRCGISFIDRGSARLPFGQHQARIHSTCDRGGRAVVMRIVILVGVRQRDANLVMKIIRPDRIKTIATI